MKKLELKGTPAFCTFAAALFTVAKIRSQPRCGSTDERGKTWHLSTVEVYSATKERNLAIPTT